jgi:hypothetical protein
MHELEKEFQRRNHENMKELFELLLKPKPREAYTTREPEEFDREAGAHTEDCEDTEDLPGH